MSSLCLRNNQQECPHHHGQQHWDQPTMQSNQETLALRMALARSTATLDRNTHKMEAIVIIIIIVWHVVFTNI